MVGKYCFLQFAIDSPAPYEGTLGLPAGATTTLGNGTATAVRISDVPEGEAPALVSALETPVGYAVLEPLPNYSTEGVNLLWTLENKCTISLPDRAYLVVNSTLNICP